MNIKKNFRGYKTSQVEEHIRKIRQAYKLEIADLDKRLQDRRSAYNQLLQDQQALKERLEEKEQNKDKEFHKTYQDNPAHAIQDAKIDAFVRIEDIIIEKESFLEDMNDTQKTLEDLVLSLKKEIHQVNGQLESILASLGDHKDIEEQIEKTEALIGPLKEKKAPHKDPQPSEESKKAAESPLSPEGAQEKEDSQPADKRAKLTPLQKTSHRTQPKAAPVHEKENKNEEEKKRPPAPRPQLAGQVKAPKRDISSSPSLLIADKSTDDIEQLTFIMEEEGYLVQRVDDAYELLDMVDHEPPFDLILLDDRLPYLGSEAIIKTIGESPSWSKVPILVSLSPGPKDKTDKDKKQTAVNLLLEGARDYLEKPINYREALNKIKRLSPEKDREEETKGA